MIVNSLQTFASTTKSWRLRACDLLPAAVYEELRPRLWPQVSAIRSVRRVRVGPNLTVLFENRETVLWHLHEILRIEGRSATRIAEELELYEPLMARSGELRATVMIDGGSRKDCERLSRRFVCDASAVELRVGGARCFAECVDAHPTQHSPLRYVRFALRDSLVNPQRISCLPVQLILRDARSAVATLSDMTKRALAVDLRHSDASDVEVMDAAE